MDRSLLIRGASLVLPDGVRLGDDVLIANGVIGSIGPGLTASTAPVIDLTGFTVAPGFFDLHVHGAGGALFEHGDVDGNSTISAHLARRGTTGILATLAALPREDLRRAVAAIAASCGREPGARIRGVHLEGPFLNPRRCGAQNPAWMRPPSLAELDELAELSGGRIRMITVAPELDGADSFIRGAVQRRLTVAIGHTEASETQVRRAVAAGATHVTHLFNAMPSLHHRELGPVGVALTEDALSVELICDGHHLSSRAVDLAVRCKPRAQLVLVSDAVAACVVDGAYDFLGFPCVVSEGVVRLDPGGRLAGSALTLDKAVRNARQWLPRLSLPELVRCVSSTPLRVAGLGREGSLEPGQIADLIVLNEGLGVVATLRAGECIWTAPELQPAFGKIDNSLVASPAKCKAE